MSLAVVRDLCSVEIRGAGANDVHNSDSKNDEAVYIIAGKGQYHLISCNFILFYFIYIIT